MSRPDFRATLSSFDINLLQETHLRPNQHQSVSLMNGYSIISRTRRPNASFAQSWGGVVVIAKASLPLRCRDDLSGPDFLVLQMNNVLIFNIYLAPENSESLEKLEKDPCDTLESLLILARNAGFWIVILGDINARTASVVANILYDPPRASPDPKTSTRGRWWCRLLNYQDMVILNGIPELGPGAAKFTSFQGTRRTVIDYAAVSRELLPKIQAFEIEDKWDGFDHASLGLRIWLDTTGEGGSASLPRPRKRHKVDPILPTETPLDKLLVDALKSADESKKDTKAVYGVVTAESALVKVAAHGHCVDENRITAAAGVATYWGPQAASNTVERVFGAQTRLSAEIHVILIAIREAREVVSLQIFTVSTDAIHQIVYCAAENKRKAWSIPNGDLLRVLAEHIRVRKAPIHFTYIDPQTPNGHLVRAHAEAERACTLPRAKNAPSVAWAVLLPILDKIRDVPKVRADLSEGQVRLKRELPRRDKYPAPHRGRDRQAAIGLGSLRMSVETYVGFVHGIAPGGKYICRE
uniref:Endonuclease/exonuclease/phosphatase domain-containing protein n=1 Tax=Mycena chlorophos TaxID=658473 RepID=A0ABQ0KWA2_MYCCL|nr:predicted protein [Mycena chlorophos]